LLIGARAVQGAGSALVIPRALALLGAAFGPERRAWELGVFSAITGVAVLGGPVIGGAVTQGVAWQWIFWINVPIGLLTIPLIVRRMSESRGARAKLDLPGLTIAAGAALGLVYGLVRSGSAGWGSIEVVGALAAGVLLTIAFVAWELRAVEPMLPMRLFASRAFSYANAATFFLWGSLSGAVFFTAQFLQIVQHHRPLDAGMRLLPWTATLFIVAPIAGKQIARFGERPLAATGLALQAIGMGSIALTASPTVPYLELAVPLMIAGAGVSMAIPAIQNAVLGAVAPADIGKASGTSSMSRQLGGVFGIAILAAAFTATGGYAGTHAFSDGFTTAIGVSAALSLAGAVAGFVLPRRHAVSTTQPRSAAPATAPASA
jgi:EmrB/QacA subfamily drug resistance transporter